jgi:hypothetical protein
MSDPHYTWLFLLLTSSITGYFVISSHENHIIVLISKKNPKKNIFNENKFQIDFGMHSYFVLVFTAH